MQPTRSFVRTHGNRFEVDGYEFKFIGFNIRGLHDETHLALFFDGAEVGRIPLDSPEAGPNFMALPDEDDSVGSVSWYEK